MIETNSPKAGDYCNHYIFQNVNVKANNEWKGGQVHQEDILAVSYSAPNLLATASFDGEINVWSLETESLYLKLRKASKA